MIRIALLKRLSVCIALLMMQCCLSFSPIPAMTQSNFELSGDIAVCSASQESVLRFCGETVDLSALGNDVFYSFVLRPKCIGAQPMQVDSFYVRVDGGKKWAWIGGALTPDDQITCHIYAVNRNQCMTPGAQTII